MNKEFLLNIFLLITINFLVKPIYLFAIDAEVQVQVGQEAYGVFFTLFNFAYLFQVINDVGIQNYTSSKMSADPSFAEYQLPRILGARLILAGLFMVAVATGAVLMGYPRSYYPLLALVAVNQVLSTFFLFLRAGIAASGKYRVDSWISALDKVLMILVLGYILYISPVRDLSVYHLVLTQTASFSVALLVAYLLLRRAIGSVQVRLQLQSLPDLLRKTWPYAMVLILMTLYTRLDTVMLERLLPDGDYQAGVYASCYRYMEALSMIGYLFAVLLLPMYARQIAERTSLQPLSQTALGVLATVVIPVAILVITYRQEVLHWRYPYADQAYFQTLALMMVSFAAVALAYIYGTMHAASGDLAKVNVVYGLGVVINVGLNLWLIPQYAVVGAAVATVGTQVFVLVGQVVLSYQSFDLKVDVVYLGRLTVFTLGVLAIAMGVYHYLAWPWLIELGLAILCSGLLSLLIKIIDVDMLLSLLRKA